MDELIKELRIYANDETDEIRFKAADAIEQLSNAGSAYGRGWTLGYDAGREESKPRWIPVADWQYGNRSIYMKGYVTHWMPLPQPPKEESYGV